MASCSRSFRPRGEASTLQRYVAALGGRLELVAAFGDKKIILTGMTAGVPATRRMEPTRDELHDRGH